MPCRMPSLHEQRLAFDARIPKSVPLFTISSILGFYMNPERYTDSSTTINLLYGDWKGIKRRVTFVCSVLILIFFVALKEIEFHYRVTLCFPQSTLFSVVLYVELWEKQKIISKSVVKFFTSRDYLKKKGQTNLNSFGKTFRKVASLSSYDQKNPNAPPQTLRASVVLQ